MADKIKEDDRNSIGYRLILLKIEHIAHEDREVPICTLGEYKTIEDAEKGAKLILQATDITADLKRESEPILYPIHRIAIESVKRIWGEDENNCTYIDYEYGLAEMVDHEIPEDRTPYYVKFDDAEVYARRVEEFNRIHCDSYIMAETESNDDAYHSIDLGRSEYPEDAVRNFKKLVRAVKDNTITRLSLYDRRSSADPLNAYKEMGWEIETHQRKDHNLFKRYLDIDDTEED